MQKTKNSPNLRAIRSAAPNGGKLHFKRSAPAKQRKQQTFTEKKLHKQFPRRRSRNFNICVNNRTNTRCAPPTLQYKQSSKQSRKQSHKQSFRAIEPKNKQTTRLRHAAPARPPSLATTLDTAPARPPARHDSLLSRHDSPLPRHDSPFPRRTPLKSTA